MIRGRNQRMSWVGQTHSKIHLAQLWPTQVSEQKKMKKITILARRNPFKMSILAHYEQHIRNKRLTSHSNFL